MSILKRKERETATSPPRTLADVARNRRASDEKAAHVEGVRRVRQRVDLNKLTLAEAQELGELHRKARDAHEDGAARTDLAALAEKERKRFLDLLDQCLPEQERERRRAVEEARRMRELERFAAEVANAGTPPRLRAGISPGEVVLPAEAVTLDTLHLADLGLLATLVYAWSSGDVLFRGAVWSDDGRALLVPKQLRLRSDELNRSYGRDGLPTSLVDLGRTLEHLTRNGFLDAERDSRGWTIRLGPGLMGWAMN